MTEEKYIELTDKYMSRIVNALDAQKIPFNMALANSIGEAICDCVIEAGAVRLFPFEVAQLKQKIDTTNLDGACHWYWDVIAGFLSSEAAEEYKTALTNCNTTYTVLQDGCPDDETMQNLEDLLGPDA